MTLFVRDAVAVEGEESLLILSEKCPTFSLTIYGFTCNRLFIRRKSVGSMVFQETRLELV